MSLANQQERIDKTLLDDTYHGVKLGNRVHVRLDERPFDTLPKPDEVFVQVALAGLDSADEYQVDLTERAQWTLSLAARRRTELIRVLDILIDRMREWRRPFIVDEVVYADSGVYAVQVTLG